MMGSDLVSNSPSAPVQTSVLLEYWSAAASDVDSMLGGYAHISTIELQGSRAFLAKLGVGLQAGRRRVTNALEGGAGIGRVTEGLLLPLADHVDVIEPVAKFTTELAAKKGVRNVFTVGLEQWQPEDDEVYDLIWIQWCVGYLDDEQLVAFLVRCKAVLQADVGHIVLKENISTSDEDLYDAEDSSVMRTDSKFRDIFKRAGLRLVKTELQKGVDMKGYAKLCPIRMYALKR
ncbi:alpha-N-methyltransferase NTM1 [Microdochium trichocladiopsis]|uniref:Alpha N-terminal protein methyltransferase 1 n=1 Tax=Microdochium trichocladiopsis TaxID=1682393 RepID=A0A9P9BKI9_9PEZI|nr:alpha-N-methyltransferase NTM1 [Microdochium trichocladiopsis]KAH7026679.1 alpha-N-methyltransferase NTM1 [Microdochium trichocladiopsis]